MAKDNLDDLLADLDLAQSALSSAKEKVKDKKPAKKTAAKLKKKQKPKAKPKAKKILAKKKTTFTVSTIPSKEYLEQEKRQPTADAKTKALVKKEMAKAKKFAAKKPKASSSKAETPQGLKATTIPETDRLSASEQRARAQFPDLSKKELMSKIEEYEIAAKEVTKVEPKSQTLGEFITSKFPFLAKIIPPSLRPKPKKLAKELKVDKKKEVSEAAWTKEAKAKKSTRLEQSFSGGRQYVKPRTLLVGHTGKSVSTVMDTFFELVKEKQPLGLDEAALKLGYSEEKIEAWADLLVERGLIDIDYPPVGVPVFKVKA